MGAGATLLLRSGVRVAAFGGLWILAAVSVRAQAPPTADHGGVIKTCWLDAGYKPCSRKAADFDVDVSYQVPGVIDATDHFYFQRDWQRTTEYADGTEDLGVISRSVSMKCRDGWDDRWCNGSPEVTPGNDGLAVTLHLAWGRHGTGRSEALDRAFFVPWPVLDAMSADGRAKVRVVVHWHKSTPRPSSRPSRPAPARLVGR